MRTILYYIEAAKERAGLASDNELTRRLGFSGKPVCHWRNGRTWPDDESMVALAELAGLDVQRALLDLNTWRCKSPKARSLYSEMAQRVLLVVAGIVISGSFASEARTLPEQIDGVKPLLYIMGNRRRLRRGWFGGFFDLVARKSRSSRASPFPMVAA